MRRTPSLSEQVRRHLRKRIANDEFESGRIPPEASLATDLGVSRTTVRDALGRLESEGAIIRKQGAGTFVNEAGLQIRARLDEIWSYEEALEAYGYTPSVELVSAGAHVAEPTVLAALGLSPGDTVYTAVKVFLENGDPVVLTSNTVPEALIDRPPTDEDARQPIYDFLEEHCQRYLSYYLSDLVPVNAPPDMADVLRVELGTALLSFEETGFDRDNEPVVYSTSYFRDDLLRFRLIRRGLA